MRGRLREGEGLLLQSTIQNNYNNTRIRYKTIFNEKRHYDSSKKEWNK